MKIFDVVLSFELFDFSLEMPSIRDTFTTLSESKKMPLNVANKKLNLI